MVTAILASRYSLKPVVIRSRAKGHNLGLPVMGDTWRVWGRAESPGRRDCRLLSGQAISGRRRHYTAFSLVVHGRVGLKTVSGPTLAGEHCRFSDLGSWQ